MDNDDIIILVKPNGYVRLYWSVRLDYTDFVSVFLIAEFAYVFRKLPVNIEEKNRGLRDYGFVTKTF